MRIVRLAFLFLVVIGVNSFPTSGSSSKPFLFTAEVSGNGRFLLGTPAIVTLRMENISGKEQPLLSDRGLWYLAGKSCSELQVGHEIQPLPGTVVTDPGPRKVASGWSKEWEYDLAQYCRIDKTGQYQFEYRYEGAEVNPVIVNITIDEPSGIDKLV